MCEILLLLFGKEADEFLFEVRSQYPLADGISDVLQSPKSATIGLGARSDVGAGGYLVGKNQFVLALGCKFIFIKK